MAFEIRRLSAVLLMAAMPAVFASCAATSTQTASTVNAGANRSDAYPDITAIVSAETQQMGDEEASAISARLTSLSNRRSSGAISEAEYRRQLAELQALRDGHGQQTLSQIQKTN
ncbi:SHOCT domain-containing protein [Shinella sp. CPCC 101442]|uniref:SHOCT domain-containing protein n=1 Tax=Shinella sp. CPCC 101442 TaxID=2932265 RepID=UPI0021523E23|nr:SHOCT domain-containing protein [Shinella sp. CPCC 101442]MCR6499488.1 SHOCT domain-containing protein [Shinella sp. CPCC 101442]